MVVVSVLVVVLVIIIVTQVVARLTGAGVWCTTSDVPSVLRRYVPPSSEEEREDDYDTRRHITTMTHTL